MDAGIDHAWAEPLTTGLALAGPDLRLCWINPALAEWLGIGPRGAVGQALDALLPPEVAVLARRVLDEARLLRLRAQPLRAVDNRRPVSADIALQAFGDGLLLEVHVLSENASARSPLSATLRGFAHEVKNPLAGLRGAAQLLQRRVESRELQALAGLIIDEADRLGALAGRLLRHEGVARLAAVNIHRLLERLAGLLRADARPPQLRLDYDPSVPEVVGDADRLQQLLLNLARNALEAGARTLTLRTRVEHGVPLGDRVLRTALRVDIADDGDGVPAALCDTLFEPLVSGRADGTGLGLALSREIAREHGGELRYASGPDTTVFSLYLPLERAHE